MIRSMSMARYNARMMVSVAFSRRLAIVGGVFLPIGETVRRWRELSEPIETLLPWADDLVLGGVLLLAAWLSRPGAKSKADDRKAHQSQFRRNSWLTAAWGFVCGAGFGSTIAQLNYVFNPELHSDVDPSGLSNLTMVLIKTALLAIGFIGLVASMRHDPDNVRNHA